MERLIPVVKHEGMRTDDFFFFFFPVRQRTTAVLRHYVDIVLVVL